MGLDLTDAEIRRRTGGYDDPHIGLPLTAVVMVPTFQLLPARFYVGTSTVSTHPASPIGCIFSLRSVRAETARWLPCFFLFANRKLSLSSETATLWDRGRLITALTRLISPFRPCNLLYTYSTSALAHRRPLLGLPSPNTQQRS